MTAQRYSLYFHIPFCTKKCPYCHFYVIPDQERYQSLYMEALTLEWQQQKSKLSPSGLTSIYFGGGTPALLGPKRLAEILSWIDPPSDVEITLEANPENENLADFRSVGINRLSLGVQSLDPTLLTTIGRRHTVSQTLESVRNAGFENLTIDLMYDLPGQTLDQWEETLNRALELPITHLSLYNLTIEAHTVFAKTRPIQPPDELSLKMLEIAVEKLESSGFKRYEISAFAKPGYASRHNTGYWTGRPFLGFGPSASSFWEGARFRNIAHLNRYAKMLKRGQNPLDFTETLPSTEAKKEKLALALRMMQGVALEGLPKSWIEALAPWTIIAEGRLKLSPRGLLFHDTVAAQIMGLD